MLTVAIIGRPNVGKSSLFNRLVGKRLALVADIPGVTRDRRIGTGRIGGLALRVIDTSGLEQISESDLAARMWQQTEQALAEADVALFVIDARAGITPLDEHFARWLRRARHKLVLVANKAEGRAGQAGLLEAYRLGLGDPVPISAVHGEGMADLITYLLPFEAIMRNKLVLQNGVSEKSLTDKPTAHPIQLAIIGKPNVGKSTLINRLLLEERLLTGPEAGLTRDSIAIDWEWRGQSIRLIDTAGLRRRARRVEKLEQLAVADTNRSIQYAQIVAVLLDATEAPARQDLSIASQVVEEGRALVIVLTKWDLVTDKAAALSALKNRLMTALSEVREVPCVQISAVTDTGIPVFMQTVLNAYEVWCRRVPTPALNRWLQAVTAAHPPPAQAGRRLRLRYITQPKSRPPSFALWVSRPVDLPEAYRRYLINQLRISFDLPGTPIRLMLRKGANPYVDKK